MSPAPSRWEPVLGETTGAVTLSDQASLGDAVARMTRQAKRKLRIFSQDLDAPLYDRIEVLDAIRNLALQDVHVPVRILLADAAPAVYNGHRLIELARGLTSRIHIRRIPKEFQDRTKAYLLADDRGYVQRRLSAVYEGTANFNAPLHVRRLGEGFERIWELSDIHQELRRLYI
ncbi:MAG: hypothetical protein U9Q81_10025 [Pseudomonadota bacterium]|nr:hypothetical protein [Pseudomonadota bacterium]